MTPERMLSESEEEQIHIPAQDMPKMVDSLRPSTKTKSENDPLSTLAMNLENNILLKDGFDLEDLKRKQEDLLLIQEMVQKNIEGIQEQIEKCSIKKSKKSSPQIMQTPKYTKKFDSDSEALPYQQTDAKQKRKNIWKSFTRSQNNQNYVKNYNQKSTENNISKFENQNSEEEFPPRPKSSNGLRRGRNERK